MNRNHFFFGTDFVFDYLPFGEFERDLALISFHSTSSSSSDDIPYDSDATFSFFPCCPLPLLPFYLDLDLYRTLLLDALFFTSPLLLDNFEFSIF